MSRPSCSVDGCANPAKGRGLCNLHYLRFWNFGDPLAGATPRGSRQKFYREALVYEGDECLIWPYGKHSNGYAHMTLDGKAFVASRLVCETVYGPPPTPDHQAAHSCGERACVNKHHLRWATPAENCADKLIHGTHNRGERNWTAKISEEQVREIISLKGKETAGAIAKRFGIARTTVSGIQNGQTWLHLRSEGVR